MKLKSLFISFLILFSAKIIIGQRQANVWYFGVYAGLDFNTGHPIPLTDGQLDRWEGVAAICDTMGKILMYTDGSTVWNCVHQIMPNGTDLGGHPSSTESAIVVPYPGKDSLFYVFTIDAEGGENGLSYSIVNMNLDSGRGDIEVKNIQLIDSTSEKVTAVKHANGRDYWVVSHGWDTDSFFVYLVDTNGIELPPQIFEIGTPHKDIGIHGNNAVGYMRLSPNGKKLAVAIQVSRIFDLFDFNDTTGVISNHIAIPDLGGSPYGVEFSPDVSKLYMTSRFYLYQADLTNPNADSIISSVVMVDSSDSNQFFGAVQLATDGKIYLAQEFSDYIGIINNPQKKADSCNFNLYGLYLNGRQSRMGLPDFIQSYFVPPDFKVNKYCFGDSTIFTIADTSGIDSVLWDFGDTSSIQNSSINFKAKHKFTDVGLFEVTLYMWRLGVKYIKRRIIYINELPIATYSNDTIVCTGDAATLVASAENSNIYWQDSIMNDTLITYLAGDYSLRVKDMYTKCSLLDTIHIGLLPLPVFDIQDTTICTKDTIHLGYYIDSCTYYWNTGDTNAFTNLTNAGLYTLRITDQMNCKYTDTIAIGNYPLPVFDLGQDTVMCEGDSIILKAGNYKPAFWNGFLTADSVIIKVPALYFAEYTDSNTCTFYDTIDIVRKTVPILNIVSDTTKCEDELLSLYYTCDGCQVIWNDVYYNEISVDTEGIYVLKATNICGTSTKDIYVYNEYCGEIYVPNIFTPNGDGVNEYFKIKGIDAEQWELSVFNRWGNLVYYSADYQNDWDGGKCPNGTYYYLLQNASSPSQRVIGFVTIYREK